MNPRACHDWRSTLLSRIEMDLAGQLYVANASLRARKSSSIDINLSCIPASILCLIASPCLFISACCRSVAFFQRNSSLFNTLSPAALPASYAGRTVWQSSRDISRCMLRNWVARLVCKNLSLRTLILLSPLSKPTSTAGENTQ